MNCPNCNSPVPEGAAFCGVCGYKFQSAPQPQPVQQPWQQAPQMPASCPNCGTKLDPNQAFCPECGMPVAQMVQPAAQAAPQAPQQPYAPSAPQGYNPQGYPQQPGYPPMGQQAPSTEKPAKEKKPIGKKGLVIAIIAVVAVLVIGALVFILTRGGGGSKKAKDDKYIVYMKDNELFYTAFGKKDPWQVTTRLFSGDADEILEDAGADEIGYDIANYTYITEDGKTIFFPDKIKDDEDGATLYYRSMTKRDAEPVKIDSKIYYYDISENNNLVTYLNSAQTVYQYDIKKGEKTKLASDVVSYQVTKDGSEILYLNTDYVLYLLEVGGEKVKISSDVASYRLTEDGNTILYTKDDKTFYLKAAGEDKVKIDSEVTIMRMYPTGEAYYYKTEETEEDAEKFVKDDKQGDTSYDYTRESLKDKKIKVYVFTYYYFDGKEATELFNSYSYGYAYNYYYSTNPDHPVLTARAYPEADFKLNLSEVSSSWIEWDIEDAAEAMEYDYQVAIGKDITALGYVSRVAVSDEDQIFYQEVPEEKKDGSTLDYADVYKVSYSKGKFGTPELVASEVDDYYWRVKDGDLYYITNYNEGTGDYYVNDTLIAYDAYAESVYLLEYSEKNSVYFVSDYTEKSETYTISLWDGSKATVVADDMAYLGTSCGKGFTYLQDYSEKSQAGDLYWTHEGKTELMDDDVQAIIPVQDYTSGHHGSGYGYDY